MLVPCRFVIALLIIQGERVRVGTHFFAFFRFKLTKMRRKGIQVISTHKYQIPAAEHYPMRKSFMIPQQLLETQIVAQNEFVDDAELVPIDAVKRVHDATFVDTFLANKLSSKAMQSIGFVWSEHLLQRVVCICKFYND